MFRALRRKNREIPIEAAKNLLKTERRGVLAVNGDDGYPYAVPVNFLYDESAGRIYFHGSLAGHKADSLRKDDKVCFTVYGNEMPSDEAWAPFMQSVVIFGRCRLYSGTDEAISHIRDFAMKYYPGAEEAEKEISVSGKAAALYEITIEHICGKQIQEK